MFTTHRIAVIAYAGLVLLMSRAVAREPLKSFDLRPKYPVGKEIRLKFTTDESSKTSVAGQNGLDGSSESKREMVLLQKCTEQTETGSIVEMRIESLKVSMTGGMMEGTFDSTKPGDKDGDNPLAAALRPMLAVTMTMDVDIDGNIKSIKSDGKVPPPDLGAGAAGQAITINGMQMMLSPISTVSKTKPKAKVGEKWATTDVLDTGGFGRLKVETQYKLASMKGALAVIAMQGTISMDSEVRGAAPAVQIKDSKYQGQLKWNTAEGMIESMNVDQSLSMEMNVGGMMTQLSQTAKTEVRRVDQ